VNESAARNVLLVRSFETGEVSPKVWSEDDRAWAGRAAAEVVGAGASREAFLERRAALAVSGAHNWGARDTPSSTWARPDPLSKP